MRKKRQDPGAASRCRRWRRKSAAISGRQEGEREREREAAAKVREGGGKGQRLFAAEVSAGKERRETTTF
ncbi:hypothetical protein ABZP36_033435 [Zizania latifolia]